MSALTRREFNASLLATAAGLQSCVSFAARPVVPASIFHDSVGVNIHPNWFNTLWGTVDWMTPLLELGVKHTRSALGTDERIAPAMRPFFNAGGKHCVILSDSGIPDKIADQLRINHLVRFIGAKNISAVEGPNEFNGEAKNWAARLRAHAQWMHRAVRAIPALNHAKLIAPSMKGISPATFWELGNIAAWVDRSNVHYYPVGAPMASQFPSALAAVRILTSEPAWMTEVGYRVAGPTDKLSRYVLTERAAAKYLARGLFDLLAAGFERSYIYALFDDVLTTKHFGLMTEPDLRKRPTFLALKNLMSLFADSGRPPAGDLAYTLAGASVATKQHLFRRSDGAWLLVLYQDVDSYNRTTFRDIEPAPARITITLPAVASKIEVFEPTFTATAKRSVISERALTVPVADHVVVVRVQS